MSTVFILLDIQVGLVARFESLGPQYLHRLNDAIAAARSAELPVIFVTTCFHPGHPEISSSNKSFSVIKAANVYTQGSESVAIHPQVTTQPHDIFIHKRRVSAFSGSDLGVVLRGLKAEKLVLAGLSTSGAVLSTLTEAADKDFEMTILENLCADPDQEVHNMLMKKVFPKRAEVTTAEDWIAGSCK